MSITLNKPIIVVKEYYTVPSLDLNYKIINESA